MRPADDPGRRLCGGGESRSSESSSESSSSPYDLARFLLEVDCAREEEVREEISAVDFEEPLETLARGTEGEALGTVETFWKLIDPFGSGFTIVTFVRGSLRSGLGGKSGVEVRMMGAET